MSEAENVEEAATSDVIETVEEAVEEETKSTYVETDNPNLQKRFGQLTSKAKQAEARANELQERLDKIEADKLEAKINKPVPTEEQFDYDQEAHANAVASHYREVGLAQGQQQAQEQAQQQVQQAKAQEIDNAYAEKVAVFAETTPDFAEAINNLQGMDPSLVNRIKTIVNGPQVAYELSKNLTLANKANNAAMAGDGYTEGAVLERVQNLIANKPKNKMISEAGKPVDSPIQAGVSASDPNKQYVHSAGATFE